MFELESIAQHGPRVVVIAEAGVNHNGDVDLAHQLVDVAAASGADFVKFQTFDPSRLVAPDAATTAYQRERGGASDQKALLDALVLPPGAWPSLKNHAERAGIGFLSTPFDLGSAALLSELGVDALKTSSGELTNLPFLRALSSLGLPLLVSTGMGSADEVVAAASACREAPGLAMFHCVSAYPAPLHDCNLGAIPEMAAATGVPVGWSDHTTGITSAVVAASLGARLFEKHFTLDRQMSGPDHAASLEPAELKTYVSTVRSVVPAVGDGRKRRMASEEANAPLVRRSWHAARDLGAGEVLGEDDVVALRPEGGLPPTVDLAGLVLAHNVATGTAISASAVGMT